MDKEQFFKLVENAQLEKQVFNHPEKGTLTVVSVTKERIHYLRTKTTVSVKLNHLYKAYDEFNGQKVTTEQLKAFKPGVFDSKGQPKSGHDSNGIFFLKLMEHMQLAGPLSKQKPGFEATLQGSES